MLYGTYAKAILLIIFVCGVFFAGWHTRDRDFTVYKDQVRIASESLEVEEMPDTAPVPLLFRTPLA